MFFTQNDRQIKDGYRQHKIAFFMHLITNKINKNVNGRLENRQQTESLIRWRGHLEVNILECIDFKTHAEKLRKKHFNRLIKKKK